MHRPVSVVTTSQVTEKDDSHIFKVIDVCMFWCSINSAHTLLTKGKLVPSAWCFRPPFKVPKSSLDVILWKFGDDKGGGSWKLVVNPVNLLENPQSVRHVQRMHVASCKVNLNVQVTIIRNTSVLHHRHQPQALIQTSGGVVSTYMHVSETICHFLIRQQSCKCRFFSFVVKRMLLMYNTDEEQCDKIKFVADMDAVLSTLTLEIPVVTISWPETRVKLTRYQLAGVFAGELSRVSGQLCRATGRIC